VETYLEGVLNAEISTKWPIEVVKSQSVISRTFALYKREKRKNRMWHVTSDFSDQVYLGADITDKRGLHAIQQTRGIVVTYNGKLAQTFYHSNCGGITEDAGALWSSSYPYLKVKKVRFGKSDPRYYWQASFTQKELKKIFQKLGFRGSTVYELTLSEFSKSGRVSKMYLNGSPAISFTAKDFRRAAGYRKIQSLLFNISKTPGGIIFQGTGNGHGVGLSQWSAKEMAEKGNSYHEILNFFYQGTKPVQYWR
jgi:stage II sporulation protein D